MIYTSYFKNYKGLNGVSIARGTPSWFDGKTYPNLSPSWSLIKKWKAGDITWKEYRKEYIKQLKAMDVDKVYAELNGKVLLCYEIAGDHCHRNIVREWFNHYGYECEELDEPTEPFNMQTCLYCKHYNTGSHMCRKYNMVIEEYSNSCENWRYAF